MDTTADQSNHCNNHLDNEGDYRHDNHMSYNSSDITNQQHPSPSLQLLQSERRRINPSNQESSTTKYNSATPQEYNQSGYGDVPVFSQSQDYSDNEDEHERTDSPSQLVIDLNSSSHGKSHDQSHDKSHDNPNGSSVFSSNDNLYSSEDNLTDLRMNHSSYPSVSTPDRSLSPSALSSSISSSKTHRRGKRVSWFDSLCDFSMCRFDLE